MKGKGKQETYWLLGDTEKNEVFIHVTSESKKTWTNPSQDLSRFFDSDVIYTYAYVYVYIYLCMI